MSKQTIITKGRKFSEVVARTVVDTAKEIAVDFWNTYGADASKEEVQELADGIGGDVGARVSEWKAFFNAVPFGLTEALNAYPKHGTLTRVKLFALARNCIKTGDYSKYVDAIKSTEKPVASKGADRTPEQKFGMGLGIIKNTQTKSPKMIAFRKDLAALCKKHGIKY